MMVIKVQITVNQRRRDDKSSDNYKNHVRKKRKELEKGNNKKICKFHTNKKLNL